MKWSATFLRSKVARRVFLLFVSCALLPITILAAISFYQVSTQLHEQSRRQLMSMSESQGMLIDERLQSVDSDLQLIASQAKGSSLPAFQEPLTNHLDSVGLFKEDGSLLASWGSETQLGKFSADELSYLNAGKTLLQTHPCAGPSGICISLIRVLDATQKSSTFLVGGINQDYLWVRQQLPAGFEACVQTVSGQMLFCSDPNVTFAKSLAQRGHGPSGYLQVESRDELYDIAYWTLLLRPGFHSPSWVITAGQKHSDVVLPIRRFRNSFPLVALLALWVVALFSSVQIRRTLVPLEKLEEGTKQIAQQQFETKVEVQSGDEFQSLAESFNSMALRLGRQFHALKTINEIDQAIFASLNHEGIVDALLDHMAFLLPCDCVAVAIFGDGHSSGTLRYRSLKGSDVRRTIASALLSTNESEQLLQNPSSMLVDKKDTFAFLRPLSESGMNSFLILPVLVNKSGFAALVCAHGSHLQLADEDIQQARQVADQLAVAFSNVQLIDALEQLHWGTLTALARAIDAKSAWTAGHSERVTALALKIGRAMGLSAEDLRIMQRGGLLHDIGKIGTPAGILDKAGRLDSNETQVMQDHVRIGVRILEPIAAFREALPIVAQHHEWFDGSGYPNHLTGEKIGIHSRIFAVADVYDALTSDRPYRKGLPREQALQMIREKSGTQFDPKVVDVFIRMCAEQQDAPAPAGSQVRSHAAAAGRWT